MKMSRVRFLPRALDPLPAGSPGNPNLAPPEPRPSAACLAPLAGDLERRHGTGHADVERG